MEIQAFFFSKTKGLPEVGFFGMRKPYLLDY